MIRNAADQALRARALKVVPGGMYGHEATTLLPASYPQFFERGEGAYIWDVDGNRYLDFMCAYGPNLLGYNDRRVNDVAVAQLAKGDTLTGPSAHFVELAEALTSMVSHADWAMFCKNGTDATTASPFKHDAFIDQALPDPAYAQRARELCDETGAMLIVDDVRAGFRLIRDCSWELVGVRPDMSCWGKSFANGHPISALLGNDRCREGASQIYVTGSFWFAAVPMAAGVETLRILRETDYLENSIRLGTLWREGLDALAAKHGFALRQTGPVQMPQILFEDDPDYRTGFAWGEEMLKRGVYVHPWHNMFFCAAMTEADIQFALKAADEAFAAVKAQQATLEPHPVVLMFLTAMAGAH